MRNPALIRFPVSSRCPALYLAKAKRRKEDSTMPRHLSHTKYYIVIPRTIYIRVSLHKKYC